MLPPLNLYLERRGRAGWGFGACARGGRKSWQRPDFVASFFRPASNASGIRSPAAKKKDRKIDVDPTFPAASLPRIRGELSEHGAEPPATFRPRSEILPRFSPRISKHSTAQRGVRGAPALPPNFQTSKLLNLSHSQTFKPSNFQTSFDRATP